jgi:putative ABC transport system permease protein
VLRITLKGLLAHKRRLASTFTAIVSGVAFLAGTLMLADTIGKTFDDLFANVYDETDAVVRSASSVEVDFGGEVRGRVDASLAATVAQVDGVAAAEPTINAAAQIVDNDGDALGNPGMGAPTFGGDWPDNDELNPFAVVEGRPPAADDEVVIDKGSADKGDLAVGDRTTVLTKAGAIEVTIVGIARFGDSDSPGGATYALFTQAASEKYLAEPGKADAIGVVATEGVSQKDLVERITPVLPEGAEAVTGEVVIEEQQDSIQEALGFFNIFLGVFAGIALVVSVFSIYNTFSIIVAQRTREMALLRAVGARRRQVLGSVMGEALALGVLASLVGLAGGIVVVGVLKGLLASFGLELPAGGLELLPRTIIVSLVVGLVVTIVSAVGPAVRASRVPPLAALRDVAVERRSQSPVRLGLGGLIAALGLASVVAALAGEGGNDALARAGIGAVLVLVGVIVLGPAIARPLGRLIGAPLARWRGVSGTLARENATRSPRRTANTAAALLIGVGVVAFFTVISSSLKQSISDVIDQTVTGDFVIDSETFGFGGISPQLADQLNQLPEVEAATGLRYAFARIDGDAKTVGGVDPATFGQLVDLGVQAGSIADLAPGTIAVQQESADNRDLEVGGEVVVEFPATGAQTLRVAAIFEHDELVGQWVIGRDTYDANVDDAFDAQVYVEVAAGVPPDQARAAIEEAAAPYANADVRSQQEFKDRQADQVNQILGLVYAMLAFAVIIALMGIANTLSLSIFERVRELGLLRAVGMTRGQLRSTVRWESVIIAVLGSVLGLAIGVLFGWVALTAADDELLTFRASPGSLLVLLVLAALAGTAAALGPARRAAKLDILQAIAAE